MKEISRKIILYSSSAGALLAVSANAQAHAYLGKIRGSDGNTILNHNGDFVYIDIDNDGLNEFLGLMASTTFTSLSVDMIVRLALVGGGGTSSESVVELYGNSVPYINKFEFNDMIGPLTNSNAMGFLTLYSGPVGGEEPAPNNPLGVPFLNGDSGYIGVGLNNPGGTNYGWIQVDISPTAEVNFIAAGMDTNLNTPIPAGNGHPVPLLPIASAAGLGLVGLMAALKRKKRSITL